MLYSAHPLGYPESVTRQEPDWDARIRGMFARIARRYDLMNTLMSFGMDRRWRRRVMELAGVPAGGLMLDVGAGTGKIAREAARAYPGARIVAADFTPEMMAVGREGSPANVVWVLADAMSLPFRDRTFDAVTSGFLVRNVRDMPGVLAEQLRVLRPGGRVVCLDAGPPALHTLEPVARFHLNHVIPRLGALVTGDAQAYRYLPESTQAFVDAPRIARAMEEAGFAFTQTERYMFGTINVVHARRPD